tara:strand:+ start:304 stop:708 length:405 start_codon:yes stop_codon:yes gene_type:complete
LKQYGGQKMNVALARNEYTNAKSNALNSKSENFEAVSIALKNLVEAMKALKDAKNPEDREPLFEKSLTSVYFLQKCLDFEVGGDLAKNLFRVYEFSRQSVLDFVLREKGYENLDKSIEYVTLIIDGWNGIEDSV